MFVPMTNGSIPRAKGSVTRTYGTVLRMNEKLNFPRTVRTSLWFGTEGEQFDTEDLLFAASKNELISFTSFVSTFCPTVFKVSVGSSGFVFVSQIS